MTAQRCAHVMSALTIDVEDYFQVSGFEDVVSPTSWGHFESRVERNTEHLLDILDDAGVTATFFVLGWTAERYPRLVRRIHAAGHELASHSYAHRLVYIGSPTEFREDTIRAKKVLEDISGEPIIGYRAPSFSITRKSLWALEILAEEGFRYDSSIFPILRDRYGIPTAPRHPFRVLLRPSRSASPNTAELQSTGDSIIEFPLATVRFAGLTLPIGGGGYLRLFPQWVFHRSIKHIIESEQQPAVLYTHPWELDPGQPRVQHGSWLSRFRHYVNLHKTEMKLRALLAQFRFGSLRAMLDSLPHVPSLTPAEISGLERAA
jgi:polysaccharide deacetylase family protein (PEP-CTERM system associated)